MWDAFNNFKIIKTCIDIHISDLTSNKRFKDWTTGTNLMALGWSFANLWIKFDLSFVCNHCNIILTKLKLKLLERCYMKLLYSAWILKIFLHYFHILMIFWKDSTIFLTKLIAIIMCKFILCCQKFGNLLVTTTVSEDFINFF